MDELGTYYHLRIHYADLSLNEIITFINDKSFVQIIVHEKHDVRHHIHCVIRPKKTISTFRQQMLAKFPTIKGNGVYSLEMVKDFDKMVRYCCKGENDELPDVKQSVYTEEQIKAFSEKYWKIISETQKASSNRMEVKCSGEAKPKKVQTWTEKVFNELISYEQEVLIIQRFQLLYHPTDYEQKKYSEAKLVLFKHMLRCYGKSAKQIDDFIVQRHWKGFLNGILARSTETGVFDNYAEKMFMKLDI